MHPKDLSILDFTYELPDEKIARHPATERDQSKLLISKTGSITTSVYHNLPDILPSDTLLIFNNTKVVEARLHFQKPTGGSIEIFCLEPDDRYADITTAMLQKQQVYWKCLVGGAKKWKEGPVLLQFSINDQPHILKAEKVRQQQDHYIIQFEWDHASMTFADLLHHAGNLPLPPYLNRAVENDDKDRYQTVYAQYDGSVAAPTAGLHFTDEIFNRLDQKNIEHCFVTLHVGAGTFKPVKAATMQDHEMHAEYIDVDSNTITTIKNQLSKNIIPVGTTSLRTVESLFWLGVKVIHRPEITIADLHIEQWDPYEINTEGITAFDALNELLQWMQRQQINRLITKTQIIITPGYRFRIISALITNFHQPQSTLLLLVAAILGDDWKKIYQHALNNDFRFLSYGDGCLLWLN